MCGIAGIFSIKQQAHDEEIRTMAECLSHRGPDAHQYLMQPPIFFGHCRLSIIDLSEAANQPMISANGRWVIMFNGEIFNYREIAAEGKFQLKTASDTEVMLEAFSLWGIEAVQKFNGMFAIALFDRLEQKFYLLLDRMGVKPLFYFSYEHEIYFASELNALTILPNIRRQLTMNKSAVSLFLQLGYIPEPHTIWNEIRKFPSGSILTAEKNSFQINSYWKPEDAITAEQITSVEVARFQLSELLRSSVQFRMISDVPFGLFLSGGIDSSLITAIAQRNSPIPLQSFSIGFDLQQYNEAEYAKEIARYIGTQHHELMVNEKDAMQLISESMDLMNEPFADSSVIPTMLVSKLASANVKMVLSGDGGDELFMGYGMYRWAERLQHPVVKSFGKPAAGIFAMLGNRYKRAAELFRPDGSVSIQQHIFSQEQYFFSSAETRMLLKNSESIEALPIPFTNKRKLSAAESQALFDIKYYLKDDLLVKVDRATMHYSIECRTPFLDYRLVEFALNVSRHLKMKQGVLKILPRLLLKEYLPEKLFQRPKQGFAIPLRIWLKKDLKYLIEDCLSSAAVNRQGVLDYSQVSLLKKRFEEGEDFLYNRLWNLIVLQHWLAKNNR